MSYSRFLFALALLVGFWCSLALAASAPPASIATDFIAERGWLDDSSGQWQVKDVEPRAFRSFHGVLSHASSETPYWLRLVIPPLPKENQSVVLLIQPATVRDLQIYLPDASGKWQRSDAGVHVSYREQGRRSLNFTFPFTANTKHVTTLYVRVHSHTSVIFPRVMTPEAVQDFEITTHVTMGLYMGLALILMSLSASIWWSTRDNLWGMAALFDLATLVQVTAPLGFLSKYIFPEVSGLLAQLHVCFSAIHLSVACLFFGALVTALDAPRWVALGYRAGAALFPVWLLLIALDRLGDTFKGINLAILSMTLWGIIAIFKVRTSDRLLRWLYRILTSFLIAYLLYWVVPVMRVGDAGQLSVYPTLPSNLFTMFMTVLILVRRTWLQTQNRMALEQAARESERRLIHEQEKHAETASFLGMLMHEIKNPLTSIRMASELLSTGRVSNADEQSRRFRNIHDSVESINTVLQRCLDLDRLERGALTTERTCEDVAQLTQRWITQHSQSNRIHSELPSSWVGTVDVPLLLLMLSNLVDNALKYSPPDSVITLQGFNHSDPLSIVVRNRVGRAGFPDRHKLFDKYYRSPQAQYRSGTGLGLYWVYRVVRLLGGSIDYSHDETHITFTLTLPS